MVYPFKISKIGKKIEIFLKIAKLKKISQSQNFSKNLKIVVKISKF